MEGLRKTAKIISQNGWSPCHDLNPGLPEHKAVVPTTRPRRSVRSSIVCLYKDLRLIIRKAKVRFGVAVTGHRRKRKISQHV